MNTSKFLMIGLLITVLTACASPGEKPLRLDGHDADTLPDLLKARGLVVTESVDRIRNYRLSGWSYLDNYNVIITAGVRDQYLVSLRSYCSNLRGAHDLGFTNTVGSLTTTDAVVVKDLGGYPERCQIRSISKLGKIESQQDQQ